jgi:hypothetical protein
MLYMVYFIISVRTEFHISSSTDALDIAIRLTAEENLHTAAFFLEAFYMLQRY